MAALTDLSDLVNRATGGNDGTPTTMWFQKVNRVAGAAPTAPIAGRPASLWTYDGVNWPGGSAPGAVAAPTDSTTGALVPFANAGGSRERWLIQAFAAGQPPGMLLIYDRLLHISGLSGTSTGAQTVGGSLTRNTGGVGNFVFAEIYTQIGASGTTITMSYTDQDNNSGATSPAVSIGATNFREVTRAIMLPLATGDYGVRAVASVTLAATTGTAGDFGITVGKPVCFIPMGLYGVGGFRDYTVGMPGVPLLDDDMCLAALWWPVVTTAPEFAGGLFTVEA